MNGEDNVWQSLRQFDDGTYGIRTGLMPIRIKGYLLPTRDEPDRLSNKDIKTMTKEDLIQEKTNLERTNDTINLLKEQGLSTINIPKKRSATSWDEWYEARTKAIAKRLENE